MSLQASAIGDSLFKSSVVAATGLEAVPGIASLDSPTAQQTKAEIRSLAAEMAQLAQTALEPDDFFSGFLPRLCAAMGAKGAAIWRLNPAGAPSLLAEHSLPALLLQPPVAAGRHAVSADATPTPQTTAPQTTAPAAAAANREVFPSESHQQILQAVAAEGQPILVPPGSVSLTTERPVNPLADALIVIPLRPQENVEFLLEVVQRPTGGPAAQRGYLRFVAQMGDLVADYLRRYQLRSYTTEHQRLQRIEQWLTDIAAAPQAAGRQQLTTEAMLELFGADRVILCSGGRQGRVVAISGARQFDPRSEIILTAHRLLRQFWQSQPTRPAAESVESTASTTVYAFQATERREAPAAAPPTTAELQSTVDQLCHTIACRYGLLVPLDADQYWCAILAYSNDTPWLPLPTQLQQPHTKERRLVHALGGLLDAASRSRGWWGLGFGNRNWLSVRGPRTTQRQTIGLYVQRWLLRCAAVALLTVVALFPVSQQVSVTAILHPQSKQMYYAPATGIVSEVLVDEGATVAAGTPLVKLTCHELENRSENLQLELQKVQDQLDEKARLLNRGSALSPLERDLLEFELHEQRTTQEALTLQIAETSERLRELTVVARQAGKVSSWDLRNRLQHHPVRSGELLVSTFDPNDKWRLQLSVPDYRAGLVATAMERTPQGAVPVRFTLTSHPDQVLEAFAVDLAPQVSVHFNEATTAERVLYADAYIGDSNALPLKKDGAIARATIDCGKTPLCWLIFRDAYGAISSRVRMLW